MNKEQLAKRVDMLTFVLVLLISSLRGKIRTEGGQEVALVPAKVLDQIENILKNL